MLKYLCLRKGESLKYNIGRDNRTFDSCQILDNADIWRLKSSCLNKSLPGC